MAGIMTQEIVHRSHLPDSDRQQGYMNNNMSPPRSSGPRDVPSSLPYKEVQTGAPASHESPLRSRTDSLLADPTTNAMELPPQHAQPERSGTGRTSKTSINHLLSPELPVRRTVLQQRRVECPDCHDSILTTSENGPSITELTEHKSKCVAYQQPSIKEESSIPTVNNDKSSKSRDASASDSDGESEVDASTPFQRKKVQANEAERYAIFAKDAQIAQIEEYRVLCAICKTWVQLRKDRPFCPLSWTAHKLGCRRRKPATKPLNANKKPKREHTSASAAPSSSAHPPAPPSTTSNPSNPSTPALTATHVTTPVQIRRTEEQRIALLQADPDAKEIEPHRVLCAICDRWIQLRKNSTYCTAPWLQHVKKCATRHGRTNGHGAASSSFVSTASMMDVDGEDELESNFEEDPSKPPVVPANGQGSILAQFDEPVKRKPGRPRKRKIGQLKAPFSTAPLDLRDGSTMTPPRLRTPTPPLDHPIQDHEYLDLRQPPTPSWDSLYAGSQYDDKEDKYMLYYHAPPPGDARISDDMPSPAPGATKSTTVGKGPDGTNKKWVVFVLQNYAENPCPCDPDTIAKVKAKERGPPLYKSRTWTQLDTSGTDSVQGQGPTTRPPSPCAPTMGPLMHTPPTHTPPAHTPPPPPIPLPPPPPPMHPPQFDDRGASPYIDRPPVPPPPPPIPPPSYHRSPPSHTPVRKEMPWDRPYPDDRTLPPPTASLSPRYRPYPPPPPHSKHAPMPSHRWEDNYRLERHYDTRYHVLPEPPRGADLDDEECRLTYTLKSIGYLFKTRFQGANDMSLDVLMNFMNTPWSGKEEFGEHELRRLVGVLGARKLLEFTPEGGLQLLVNA